MTTLADFQTAASEITTATQKITDYVQSTGMTPAEQAESLATIQFAVAALNSAIPGGVEPVPSEG